jgi:integrase
MMSLAEAFSLVQRQERQKQEYLRIRSYIMTECPKTIRALQLIDIDNTTPKRRKGYNLVKRENKRFGFVYYVRYSHGGKMLPSKWNTHTNILTEAEKFALSNKERLVERYLQAHDTRAFALLERFYSKDSEYLLCEEKRNHSLSEKHRKDYHTVITKRLIPFLTERKIKNLDAVTTTTLSDFQDLLLSKKIKPQTVNAYCTGVKKVFVYLARKGMIRENPYANLQRIPVHEDDQEARGCYELEKVKGIFNEEWEDTLSYLLCLLIYTTGMRNGEIIKIKMPDIISMEGRYFINIKESKTPSGIRMVPLHDFVYKKLAAYAAGKAPEEPLFNIRREEIFIRANAELALQLEVSEEELAGEHITFYSGRHFWKTLLNSGELGEDVEEVFMGHKVSGDVAKLYNHRDKQGKKLILKKAEQVISILDRELLTVNPR